MKATHFTRPSALRLLLFASLLGTVSAAEPARPLVTCPLIAPAAAPTIDGTLAEPIWAQAPVLSAFRLPGGGPASQQTHARLLCDGQRLYVGAVCDETLMTDMEGGGISARRTEHDGDIWNDDCIEVFLAPRPDSPEYFHIIVGAGGGIYDARGKDKSFDADIAAEIVLRDAGWTLEAVIDLRSLVPDGGPPATFRQGDVMHFNLCREERPHGELSCWSAVGGGFHNRAGFGDLVLGSLDDRQAQLLQRLDRALAAARQTLPDLDTAGQAEFSKLEAWEAYLRVRIAATGSGPGQDALIRTAETLEQDWRRLAMRSRGLFLWAPDTWQLPMPEELPNNEVPAAESVAVWTLANEWEVAALAVTNPTDRGIRCRAILTDFQSTDGAVTVPAEQILTVRTPVVSRLSSGARMLDALPRLQEGNLFGVGAGATQVLWLTFRTRGLEPGRYNGGLTVYDLERTDLRRHVRLTLCVYPVPLADGPLPYTECWDRWSALKGIPLAARQQHYRDYYLNVSTVHVPDFPGYNAQANTIAAWDSRDFSRLDRVIAETRDFTALYLLDVQPWHRNVRLGDAGLGMWSDEYNRRLAVWMTAIRDHLAELGLEYDQWAWFPQDEPSNYEASTAQGNPLYFPDICKAIKRIDPNMRIYTTWGSGSEAAEKMLPDCLGCVDIFHTIPQNHVPQPLRDLMASGGAQVWDYQIGFKADGYWKLRGSLPLNVTVGSRGMGFWSWTYYQGASNWDSDDNRTPDGDCAVIYCDNGTIIPSLRAENFRQGVEDFRYWLMLDRAIAAAEAGVDTELVNRARAERDRLLTGKKTPPSPNSPAWVEDVRTTIRQQLIALGTAGGTVDPAAVRAVEDPGPACLTGNGGMRAANLHVPGVYWHDQELANERTPAGNWQMAANEPIHFRAADAPEGHPQAGRCDGALTGAGHALEFLYGNPVPDRAAVTFDLTREFMVERVCVAPIMLVLDGGVTVEVKAEAADAEWIPTGISQALAGDLDKSRGMVTLPLAPRRARYLRLHLQKPPRAPLISLHKVQIWGRPVGQKSNRK